jgi:dTDP-4-amino-4,6-dideoxygalactose transaminase
MLIVTRSGTGRSVMAVPLLDVNAQNLPLETELRAAFERVLRSGHFILGSEVENFERQLAAFLGVNHALGISSGTDAILLALMALDIRPGDEILCPSFTFFATAGCIARMGATPVFVDSLPRTFNLDPQDAARKITSRTKAIIPVHLFGQCADMDPILDLARSHNLTVIEDAAQSLGAKNKNRQAGTMGEFGTYSFFPSKNLGGLGDAGLLTANDDQLAEKARLLRTHGAHPKYFHKLIGANFRLDALQAAFLSVKLPHYREYTTRRQANAQYYQQQLSALPGVVSAGAYDPQNSGVRIVLPTTEPDSFHIWNQFTLRVLGVGSTRRDSLRQHLLDARIGNEIYYPIPLHQQECFRYAGQSQSCPIASQLALEVLSIPIYPELTSDQLDQVIAAIRTWLGQSL